MEELQIKTSIQVGKPREEVFEAIVNPEKMANYFISESSGRMESGKTLEWKFPEFEDRFPIEVGDVRPPEYVSFIWEGSTGKQLLVEIHLTEINNGSTLIKIAEGKMENTPAGIAWLGSNSEGWANFLACLKAYLEYDINLRKGAFDFMRK